MGAINNAFNRAGWSILELASATAKYRALRNEEGKNRAKQSYNTAATIKKQNDELTQNQVETPKPAFADWISMFETDEQKIAEQKALEEIEEKAKVARFGEIPTVNAEQNVSEEIEEKAKATSFDELAGVEEAPAPKQATSFDGLPTVSAEHSETNIDAKDPEVQGLIEVKQKNALRAAAASRAQKKYQASKGYENDFPIRDYMPDVSDEELRKAGITKTELNKLSSILAGNGTYEDVRNWFEKHGGADGAYTIKLDDLYVTKQAADAIKNYILNKDDSIEQQWEEYELSKAEEEPEEENYKVWQDESTEDEKDETKKDKGIIF